MLHKNNNVPENFQGKKKIVAVIIKFNRNFGAQEKVSSFFPLKLEKFDEVVRPLARY